MKKNLLDRLEKRINLEKVRRQRKINEKAQSDAKWMAFLQKKREYCKQILETRGKLAEDVHAVFPAYQNLLASPEWTRLERSLNYLENRFEDRKKKPGYIELPYMSIDWSVPAAFGPSDKRCKGIMLPFPYSTWSNGFKWRIGGKIVLRNIIHRGKYISLHHEYDFACFSEFEDLAKPISTLRPKHRRFASDPDLPDVASGEAQAAVILCIMRFLKWISKGKIIGLVAENLIERV